MDFTGENGFRALNSKADHPGLFQRLQVNEITVNLCQFIQADFSAVPVDPGIETAFGQAFLQRHLAPFKPHLVIPP